MSFWQTFYHIVWSTKQRAELITPEVEDVLYPYIRAKADEFEVGIHAINGWYEHVHLVVSIPPKHAISYIVKNIKGSSTHYLNHVHRQLLNGQFKWQRGYGVMSLGKSRLDFAIQYVNNQKKHHTESTTNSWLERCDEVEGSNSSMIIRESQAHYETRILNPF